MAYNLSNFHIDNIKIEAWATNEKEKISHRMNKFVVISFFEPLIWKFYML